MEAICAFETTDNFQKPTGRYIPKYRTLCTTFIFIRNFILWLNGQVFIREYSDFKSELFVNSRFDVSMSFCYTGNEIMSTTTIFAEILVLLIFSWQVSLRGPSESLHNGL
jgi:hypothetical protein